MWSSGENNATTPSQSLTFSKGEPAASPDLLLLEDVSFALGGLPPAAPSSLRLLSPAGLQNHPVLLGSPPLCCRESMLQSGTCPMVVPPGIKDQGYLPDGGSTSRKRQEVLLVIAPIYRVQFLTKKAKQSKNIIFIIQKHGWEESSILLYQRILINTQTWLLCTQNRPI